MANKEAAPAVYASAMDKLRDEMAKDKSGQIQLLGEGMTAMLQLHPEWEGGILAKGKTLAGALGAVRKNATGGCSDPIRTTRSLCEYYGIPCEDHMRLGLEVTSAMMGGTTAAAGREATSPVSAEALSPSPEREGYGEAKTSAEAPAPDPFDLDALMGGDAL